ncbi:MAG TPA: class III extradiol ring-cleavage dioxygenase [Planctomycetota bacterium]
MSALFVSHGSPAVAVEDDAWSRALAAWAARRPKPRAAVVMSAHWEGPLAATASAAPGTIHDFAGFPEALYRLTYPAPGAPELAKEVARRTGAALDARRGLDHGAWVPLRKMYPDADVPVTQLSVPLNVDLRALGRALAELRKDGVLLMGSGGAVHNLRSLTWGDKDAATATWAKDFDRWVAERAGDADALAGWATAPEAARAHPTPEHFLPILFAAAAALPGDRLETIYEGFHYGTLSMRTFARVSA